MANTLITPSMVARETLIHLENHIVFGGLCHREYRKEFTGGIGDTITIRRPVQFTATDGATRSNQDATENTTSLVINKRKHVSFSFSSQELTLDIEEFADRYIKPAAIVLANQIDVDLANEAALNFPNVVGTAGTTPATFSALTDVAKRMDSNSVPDDGNRHLVLDPDARWSIAAALGAAGATSVYNSGMVEGMVRRGYLGELAGLKIYGDQNVPTLTFGARPNTAGDVGDVDGAPSNLATSVVIDDAASNTANYLVEGDVITFAGVNAVNTVSKADTGRLMEFLVTGAVTSAAGAATIPIYPALNDGSTAASAAYQNVTALPANDAAITVVRGTSGAAASTAYTQNIGFHKNALALVTVPLDLPDSANYTARMAWNGFSIRVVKDYDIDDDLDIIRLDTLYGVKAIYPELGVRLFG